MVKNTEILCYRSSLGVYQYLSPMHSSEVVDLEKVAHRGLSLSSISEREMDNVSGYSSFLLPLWCPLVHGLVWYWHMGSFSGYLPTLLQAGWCPLGYWFVFHVHYCCLTLEPLSLYEWHTHMMSYYWMSITVYYSYNFNSQIMLISDNVNLSTMNLQTSEGWGSWVS